MSAVRLRGHHLICLQHFRGEGYDAAFIENLTDVLRRLEREPALVVTGADDVCAACPSLSVQGECTDESAGEAEIRRIDALALEGLGLAVGDVVHLDEVAMRLSEDAELVERWRHLACEGCVWAHVCEPGWERLPRSL